MANKAKRKKVTQLPLIADCRISKSSNPALVARHVFPTLTAQLESLGGEIYEVPLSVRAMRGLLLALAGWEPLYEVMTGFDYPERPKSQYFTMLRRPLMFPLKVANEWTRRPQMRPS